MTAALGSVSAAILSAQPGLSTDGIPFVIVPPADLPQLARALRDDHGYIRFIDLTAVDDLDEAERFELQYLLYSMEARGWVRIKVRTADSAPSLTSIFAGANWYEREVYDLFGVTFPGHPDLTRILMPDDWQGHPLRKDYPIGGEPVDFTVTRDVYGTGERRG